MTKRSTTSRGGSTSIRPPATQNPAPKSRLTSRTHPKNLTPMKPNANSANANSAKIAAPPARPAAGPKINLPKTPAGWTERSAARPALLDLLHDRSPVSKVKIMAALGRERWVAGMLSEATRTTYKTDKLWAAEVPVRDGAGRTVGRVIVGTTETGNVGTYHEGARGVVGLGSDRTSDELVLLESPMEAWAANSAGVVGVRFLAEHAGWRNPAWAKLAVRPNATPLTDPTLKSLMQRLLAA